jgi:hypothetical protein
MLFAVHKLQPHFIRVASTYHYGVFGLIGPRRRLLFPAHKTARHPRTSNPDRVMQHTYS